MEMIDLTAADFIDNPYPALKLLRQQGAPQWHEQTGTFLAAGFKDASQVLRNRDLGRIFEENAPSSEWETFNWLHSDSILDSEPPKHSRLRSLVMKAFNPKKIESLRPDVERITKELLDEATKKHNETGQFDLIGDYAEPLPVKVIAFLLGFPVADENLLRPWSQSIVKMYEVSPSETDREEAKLASIQFASYVHELMLERKKTRARI